MLSDRLRFVAAVGGVAFVVGLILMIQALYAGYRESAKFFVESVPTDFWVGQAGSFDLYRSTSIMSPETTLQVSLTNGVSTTAELRSRQARFTAGAEDASTLFLSFAPTLISSIAPVLGIEHYPEPGEIAISQYVHRKLGLDIGDQIMIAGHPLKIVEVLKVKSPPFGAFSVVNYDDSNTIFNMQDDATYLLVTAQDPTDLSTVAAAIEERVPTSVVYTKDEFSANSTRTITEFLPVIGVILAATYIVGTVITGLTIYTSTVEKTRDYGVLKAIGAKNSYVYGIVIFQSLAVSILGFAIGAPLAYGASLLASSKTPEFITEFQWTSAIITFIAVVTMGFFAAVLPVRRVTSIDPAMVFRA